MVLRRSLIVCKSEAPRRERERQSSARRFGLAPLEDWEREKDQSITDRPRFLRNYGNAVGFFASFLSYIYPFEVDHSWDWMESIICLSMIGRGKALSANAWCKISQPNACQPPSVGGGGGALVVPVAPKFKKTLCCSLRRRAEPSR